MSERPDIFVFMCDQMTPFMLGAYGQAAAQSPVIDGLSAEGVTFDAAYCNHPLCAPSRASMAAGRLPRRIRAFDNGSPLDCNVPTFMHAMRGAGYETVLSGKAHFIGPDQHHGFQRRLTADCYPAAMAWMDDWSKPQAMNVGASVQRGHLFHSEPREWMYPQKYDQEVFFHTRRFLLNRAERGSEQPLFMMASFTQPHEPFSVTREYWDRIDPATIPEPKIPAQPADQLHQMDRWLKTFHGQDDMEVSPQVTQCARRAYMAMILWLDDRLGELRDVLAQTGRLDNTIIAIVSDHGEMLGERGCWFKRYFYEWSARVPLIFWGLKWIGSGLREGRAVSLIDLFPTFCELGGAEPPEGIDGQSLAPLLTGKGGDWKDEAIVEYPSEGVRNVCRMVRRGKYKYMYVHNHPPRLFDVEADPAELEDLAGRAESAEVQRQLHDRCLEGWDPDEVERLIRQDQQDRLYVTTANEQGGKPDWEARPEPAELYMT